MKYLPIIFCASLLLSACGGKTVQTEEEKSTTVTASNEVSLTAAQAKNAGIVTGMPEQKTIATVLKVNGVVDVPPQNMVSISMPLGGYIKSMKLLPGMRVFKGQVLAVMEDPQYIQIQQDYLTAMARLSFTEKQYTRQQTLNKSKATSDMAFQEAEAENRSQRVLVQSLGEKLRLIGLNPDRMAGGVSRTVNLYAPIDGYVSKVLVNPGKYVAPTDVLFELVNPADIHLALIVFEKDLRSLFVGQEVIAYSNSMPDKKHRAKILLIPRDLSPDRSVEVHCHFEDYDPSLVPGTFMNAEIQVRSHDALSLPTDALVRFENKQYAFIVKDNNHFEMIPLITGETENGYTSISPADSIAGKTFVVKGAYSLLMKLKNTDE